jgi:excisionase family DNA binding protein
LIRGFQKLHIQKLQTQRTKMPNLPVIQKLPRMPLITGKAVIVNDGLHFTECGPTALAKLGRQIRCSQFGSFSGREDAQPPRKGLVASTSACFERGLDDFGILRPWYGGFDSSFYELIGPLVPLRSFTTANQAPQTIGYANEERMNNLGVDGKKQIDDASPATLEKYHPEPVWDCHQAARFLCIHPATVKRLAREGKLPAFRIGNRWRFRPSELDAWARSTVLSTHSLRRE